jgi:hypothetical protein
MITGAFKEIMSILLEKSREGKVNWQRTSARGMFAVYLEKFSILLSWEEEDQFSAAHWTIHVLDKNGNTMELMTVNRADEDWSMTGELYELARRKAHKVDEAIADMKRELEELGSIGKEPPDGKKDEDSDLPF